jgi:hypothetical protein
MSVRLESVLRKIDDVNAADPVSAESDGKMLPRASHCGKRMSAVLEGFMPDALRIAARAQHIERWAVPRANYAEGRIACFNWRKDPQKYHAENAAGLCKPWKT